MRAQRELRKAQKKIDAMEKETKKITANYNRLVQFLGPKATTRSNSSSNNNLNIQSYRSNSSNTKSTRSNNNAFLNNLERRIANNNKRRSNENAAIFANIRKTNSNTNTETFEIVDNMLKNTMRNHRAGTISNNQKRRKLAEYLNLIGNRYRNSNRGLALEKRIRFYMGSKKIR